MNASISALRNERNKVHNTLRYIRMHSWLYLMLVPGLLCMFIFHFLPYYGIQIAFKDYNLFGASTPLKAIGLSKWVGFTHFEKLWGASNFIQIVRNTLEINGLRIIVLFPLQVIVAILLSEVRSKKLAAVTRTMIYVPYFFSWVIIYGIFNAVLGTYGLFNNAINSLGLERINFFSDPRLFRVLLIFTDGWKTLGYNVVIFMAAIAGLDIQLYEAAKVDGANKLRQIWHVTIPGILPTVVLMFIIKVGNILTAGFEQVLIFYNPAVYDSADIIQTYIYRVGLGQLNFSLSTAMGLFNSVVAFILIVGANTLSTRTLHRSIW